MCGALPSFPGSLQGVAEEVWRPRALPFSSICVCIVTCVCRDACSSSCTRPGRWRDSTPVLVLRELSRLEVPGAAVHAGPSGPVRTPTASPPCLQLCSGTASSSLPAWAGCFPVCPRLCVCEPLCALATRGTGEALAEENGRGGFADAARSSGTAEAAATPSPLQGFLQDTTGGNPCFQQNPD